MAQSSEKVGLLETNDWEWDPPGVATYPTTHLPDDATRNPPQQDGQASVWLNPVHPDPLPTTIDEILAPYGPPDRLQPGHTHLACCHVSTLPFTISIAVLTTLSSMGLVVTLPIYSEFVETAGSDPYVIIVWVASWTCAIFFFLNFASIVVSKIFQKEHGKPWKNMLPQAPWLLVAIIGTCSAFNGLFAVYACNPLRTPGYLQALLACTIIPFTILFRYFLLRKGVSTIRFICCLMVLVGLFIASEPEVFDLTSGGDNTAKVHHSLTYRILWPLCFAISMVPLALSNVLIEKGCKKQEVQNLAFLAWSGLFQCLVLLFFFWTDLIRRFGFANNIHEFSEHLKIGLECHVGLRPECPHLVYIPWIFIGFYMLTTFSSFLLTRYAEGAVYTSIVSSLATPMAALFWSVFSSEPFQYNPQFTVITAYTLAGLALMLPGSIMYNYFAIKEEKEQNVNALWRDIMSENEIDRGDSY